MNAIELINVSKRFPGVLANDRISIEVEKGKIHAIVGENGAGKSTLMNIVYGLIQPTSGTIKVNGETVQFASSKDAISAGIGMVHQHFMLIDKMTVMENIVLGQEPGSWFYLNRKLAYKQTKELSEKYKLVVDPLAYVRDLSVTMQQRVEVLKILYRKAEILIFDEPTAILTPQETKELCSILKSLSDMGKTIIFISHKLEEVMDVADKITVIRQGKVIGTVNKSETDINSLTQMIVGREIKLGGGEKKKFDNNEVVIKAENINYEGGGVRQSLHDICFEAKRGEILGIAGVDGNGQEELIAILSGKLKPGSGSLTYLGKSLTEIPIKSLKALGFAIIPEDRQKDGLVLSFSIMENLILGYQRRDIFKKYKVFMNNAAIREHAIKLKTDFDIRTGDISYQVGTLSGGNQQKVIISREIHFASDVILAVQPTRGLDIGAMEFVQNTLVEQRNKGKAVILCSLELDEICMLSDRIAVLYKGKIVDIIENKGLSRNDVGHMMLYGKSLRKAGNHVAEN
jgi:ABC-type uncharacterized transport system ATPase subunit